MQALGKEICYKLQNTLNNKKEFTGIIHSVFNRVCNITFDSLPIVSLILESIPMKPMAVSLKNSENFSMHYFGLKPGQRVVYSYNKLEILEANFTLYLNDLKSIDCRPNFNFSKGSIDQVRSNILELSYILENGNPSGLLPMLSDFKNSMGEKHKAIPPNIYSQFAWPRTIDLIKSITQLNFIEITNASRRIVGLGPGLTPSSDDMLIGLMISLIYASYYYNWNEDKIKSVNSSILNGAEGKTSQLSYEMMSFAAQGEVTENIHQLMTCIYSDNTQSFYKSTISVMDYGETSGSDLLLGIYIGCSISTNINTQN